MENVLNKFKTDLDAIVTSLQSNQEKLSAISEIIGNLNLLTQNVEITLAAEAGALLARNAGRPEMVAQFLLMRAKSEITKAGQVIDEMKNLTMSLDWIGFALESASNRYLELHKSLNFIWDATRSFIDNGYKFLNEKPYVGVVGYCHSIAGQIYGQYYLQLKLFYLTTGRPWRAKIGNYKICQWLGFDNLLILDKKSRRLLMKARKDCLYSLQQAIKLFKQDKAYEYIIDAYLSLALEYHSFNDAIRSKFYLFLAKLTFKKNRFPDNHRLMTRIRLLEELPLIGSNRDA